MTEAQVRRALERCDDQISSAAALLMESREVTRVALALKRIQARKKRALLKRLQALEKAKPAKKIRA
jgi:hypothetical protein